jgi:hypothetical protein
VVNLAAIKAKGQTDHVIDATPDSVQFALCWCDPVGIDHIGADQRANHAYPFLDQVYGCTLQFEFIASTCIPAQVKSATIA